MFVFQLQAPDKRMNEKYYMFYKEDDVKHLNNGKGIFIEMGPKTYRDCLNEFNSLDVQKVRSLFLKGKLEYRDYNEKSYKDFIKTGDSFVIGKPKKPKADGIQDEMRFDNIKAIYQRGVPTFCPCVVPFDDKRKNFEQAPAKDTLAKSGARRAPA